MQNQKVSIKKNPKAKKGQQIIIYVVDSFDKNKRSLLALTREAQTDPKWEEDEEEWSIKIAANDDVTPWWNSELGIWEIHI